MRPSVLTLIATAAFAGVAFLPDAAVARPAPAPRTKQVRLVTPAEVGAAGNLTSTFFPATKTRSARSRLVLAITKLKPRATYSLTVTYRASIFDATHTTILPNVVKTDRTGHSRVVWDTQGGGALPLGGSFKDHVGRVLRVHDAADKVVLSGKFPGVP